MARALSAGVILLAFAACTAQRPTNKEWKAGQKANEDKKAAEAAKQSKMAAVDKVVSMLEDLQLQVLAEGEAEAATYNKFACFCKTTQKDKSEAIKEGQTNKEELSTHIEKLQKRREALDKEIAELAKDIKKTEKHMKKITEERDATHKVYLANQADLDAALYALKHAIEALKSSEKPGAEKPTLIQFQGISKTVREAALLADALGLGGEEVQK